MKGSIEGKSNDIPVEFGIKIKKKLTSFQNLLPAFTSWYPKKTRERFLCWLNSPPVFKRPQFKRGAIFSHRFCPSFRCKWPGVHQHSQMRQVGIGDSVNIQNYAR